MRTLVSKDRTILVVEHPNGSMTVAIREHPDAVWGPPVDVEEEK